MNRQIIGGILQGGQGIVTAHAKLGVIEAVPMTVRARATHTPSTKIPVNITNLGKLLIFIKHYG